MVVLSRLYFLFNLLLATMAFLKALFIKGLLLYLRYYCFKGEKFPEVKLKVVSSC